MKPVRADEGAVLAAPASRPTAVQPGAVSVRAGSIDLELVDEEEHGLDHQD